MAFTVDSDPKAVANCCSFETPNCYGLVWNAEQLFIQQNSPELPYPEKTPPIDFGVKLPCHNHKRSGNKRGRSGQ
jgi:hypothetical protein